MRGVVWSRITFLSAMSRGERRCRSAGVGGIEERFRSRAQGLGKHADSEVLGIRLACGPGRVQTLYYRLLVDSNRYYLTVAPLGRH